MISDLFALTKHNEINNKFSLCRYSWSKQKLLVQQLQEGMRRQAMYQGTDLEREIRSEFEKDDVGLKDA